MSKKLREVESNNPVSTMQTSFVIAGVSVLLVGIALQVRQQVTNNLEQKETVSEKLMCAYEKFDFKRYIPPENFGKVTERYFVDGQTKTVILIPDMHAKTTEELQAGAVPESNQHQLETFHLISDLLSKQKQMALVMEGYPSAEGEHTYDSAFYRKYPDKAKAKIYKQLFTQSSLDKRYQIAEIAIEKEPQHAAILAGFVFWDQLQMIGTESRDAQLKKDKQLAETLTFERSIFPRPEVFCESLYPKIPWKELDEAQKVHTEKMCKCQMAEINAKLYQALIDSRCNEVAQTEAVIATSTPENTVILVAGAMHAEQQMETLKKLGVNYLVLMTNTADAAVSKVRGLCEIAKSEKQKKNVGECENIPAVTEATLQHAMVLVDSMLK